VNSPNTIAIETQAKATYTAVGEAISAWSHVEDALLKIYVSAVGLTVTHSDGPHHQFDPAAVAVLHSVRGFHPRLKMIHTAILSNLEGLDAESASILECWKSVKKSASALSKHRDSLAHWQVLRVGSNDGTTEVCLFPPLNGDEYIKHMSNADQHIMLNDIIQWRTCFYKCADELKSIYWRIGSHQALRDKFLQRMASQIRNILPNDHDVLCRLTANAPWLVITLATNFDEDMKIISEFAVE
jgi:hypothetical protein